MSILSTILVITNIGFTVAYDTDARSPLWVSYDLEPSEVVKTERKNFPFKSDERAAGSDVQEWYSTSSNRWDRGHLAPAADFNWDTNALRQTYLFTNICPMTPKLNRGAWARTEENVRNLASSGTVHVVVFPTYGENRICANGVPVPTAFVKVAFGWFGVKMWELENR